MAHIIETIKGKPIPDVASSLRQTHRELLEAIERTNIHSKSPNQWGIEIKRLVVDLSLVTSSLVEKSSEKFVELINILATVERTIDALDWFNEHFPTLIVEQCHPSTSDEPEGNDIVLVDKLGNVKVRCEVCDVASNKASQNGKEKSDLKKLGCEMNVPNDNVGRYIATSKEFSQALMSSKRKWANLHYHYRSYLIENSSTVILKVSNQ